jgi:bifunctional ADP-heptose synthase (sugar kinase/adenylyltransferase)
MVDGGFDPLHGGHVAYFAAAAELGLPVVCNVTGDSSVAKKHPPLLTQEQRGRVIDSIRTVAYTHLAEGSTASVLRALQPRIYAKGADWRGMLPTEEDEVCRSHSIDVVYLDTVVCSSTELIRNLMERMCEQTVERG